MAKKTQRRTPENLIAEAKRTAAVELDLSGLALRALPKGVGELAALRRLNLSYNQLTTVPEVVGELAALQTLNLSYNKITTVPEAMGELVALQTLYLYNNQLTAVPKVIGKLTALRELSLSNNQLTTVPEVVGNLTALRTLYLYNNPLKTVPEVIEKLRALQTLYLYNNQLTTVPAMIGKLTALKTLSLAGNELTALPELIGKLTALQGLDVSRNQLKALPEVMGRLTRLHSLDVSGNELKALPEALGRLTRLRYLDVSGNQLKALPEAVGRLTALQRLDVSRNQLRRLPDVVGKLKALETLEVSGNQLRRLPEVVGKLRTLETLNVSGNQLRTLPEVVGKLKSLQTLNVSGNQLRRLPEVVGTLTVLERLDVSGNQLTTLPKVVGSLTALKALFLHGNPKLDLPDEVLGPTWTETSGVDGRQPKLPAEILEYYFRIQNEGGRALNECKLIVVGRGGAGKTSLVKRLSGQRYDPKEPETHGITIQKLVFDGNSGPITSRVWDFGGQVVLHSMHEFFLTARSLYLLVLGERDDMLERDAAYWLQLIRSYAGDAPVVVALNKSAGRQRVFDRITLEKNYGPILGWVATECSEAAADKGNITELRKTLIAALASPHMDSVRRKFPAKWFAIKDALEEMNESYLDHATYVAKCEALGETDVKEQAALAGDLHDLGIALNYGRDPRLRDTTVLRPDWLANGIYAVLRANDLDHKHLTPALNVALAPDGIVTPSSMARIHKKAEAWGMLMAADYPADKRAFLLRLMDLFHLSYPLDDEGTRQLVPTLLPLETPESAEEPSAVDRVRLRYEFQVVPAPLLPWFIARTFSLIPDRKHWRRGTMLVFGDALSRVWTTQDERYVYATVAGAKEDSAELLTMIRGTFNELFQDYRGLQVSEQWEHEGEWVPRKTLEQFGRLQSDPQSELGGRSEAGSEIE